MNDTNNSIVDTKQNLLFFPKNHPDYYQQAVDNNYPLFLTILRHIRALLDVNFACPISRQIVLRNVTHRHGH